MLLHGNMFAQASALHAPMTWLLLLTTTLTFTVATPLLKHEIEELTHAADVTLLRRQTSSGGYTPVTGITGFGTPPRLEIRQLQKNVDQFNLYILALDRFMKANETDKLSYYQISGIAPHSSAQASWLTSIRHSWTAIYTMGQRRPVSWKHRRSRLLHTCI